MATNNFNPLDYGAVPVKQPFNPLDYGAVPVKPFNPLDYGAVPVETPFTPPPGIPHAIPEVAQTLQPVRGAQDLLDQTANTVAQHTALIQQAKATRFPGQRRALLRQAAQQSQDLSNTVAANSFSGDPKDTLLQITGQMLQGAPANLGQLIYSTAAGLVNVFNPNVQKNTLANIGKLLLGAGEKLIPGRQGQEKYIEAAIDYYKHRYGGDTKTEVLNNIADTAVQDPSGFLLDLSLVMSAAGKGLDIAGQAASELQPASGQVLGQVGQVATQLGKDINPLFQTVRAGVAVGKGLVSLGRGVAGATLGTTSGGGIRSALEVQRNPQIAGQAISGDVSGEDILDQARTAFKNVLNARSSEAKTGYSNLGLEDLKLDKSIADDLATKVSDKLDELGISVSKGGKLDFEKSSVVDEAATRAIQRAYDKLADIADGNKPVAIELERAKRFLSDLYKPQSEANPFTQSLRKNVTDILKNNVEGYSGVTKNYESASEAINHIENALFTKNKGAIQTALNKVSSAMNDNRDFRNAMLEELSRKGGNPDLPALVAGGNYSSYFPGNLRKILATAGVGGTLTYHGILSALSTLFSPGALISLASLSPKIVGRFLQGLGYSQKATLQALEAIKSLPPEIYQAAGQTGALRDVVQNQQPIFKSNQ